jgi:hypothetical protein
VNQKPGISRGLWRVLLSFLAIYLVIIGTIASFFGGLWLLPIFLVVALFVLVLAFGDAL